MKLLLSVLILLAWAFLLTPQVFATVDPLSVFNNRFGIHIISPTIDEASSAANLVNSNGGDWGYVTFVIESKDRDQQKWDHFFDILNEKHLIPIVRIATKPNDKTWEVPYDGEEQAWANFLDNLPWSTKNRYIVIYNEPNHSSEWGGSVDPKAYALVLNKTILALKQKSDKFFVMNAGFDASTPQQLPNYGDEAWFLSQMNQAVPGIFNQLDGWVSHSYPNPGFIALPTNTGRGSIVTYRWEMDYLKSLGLNKDLPIFITETGWQHSDGLIFNRFYPTPETVATYYQYSFTNIWNDSNLVAITPFLLDYKEAPFDHFAFKKANNENYPHYAAIASLAKIAGQPILDPKPTPTASPSAAATPAVLAATIMETPSEPSFGQKILNFFKNLI